MEKFIQHGKITVHEYCNENSQRDRAVCVHKNVCDCVRVCVRMQEFVFCIRVCEWECEQVGEGE